MGNGSNELQCAPSTTDPGSPKLFKLLFSKYEAALALAVSVRTIDNLISAKLLPVKRIGRRTLIHRKDLEILARRDSATGVK